MKVIFALLTFALCTILCVYFVKEAYKDMVKVYDKRQYGVLVLVCAFVWLVVFNLEKSSMLIQLSLTYSFTMTMVIIAYIDFKTGYIYDHMIFILSIVNGTLAFFNGISLRTSFGGLLTGGVFYGIIYVMARLYYKREAFGLGDIYLLAASGLILGPLKVIIVGFLAFYVAAICILIFTVADRSIHLKSELPFGPYVAIASLFVYFKYDVIVLFYRYFSQWIVHFF